MCMKNLSDYIFQVVRLSSWDIYLKTSRIKMSKMTKKYDRLILILLYFVSDLFSMYDFIFLFYYHVTTVIRSIVIISFNLKMVINY